MVVPGGNGTCGSWCAMEPVAAVFHRLWRSDRDLKQRAMVLRQNIGSEDKAEKAEEKTRRALTQI